MKTNSEAESKKLLEQTINHAIYILYTVAKRDKMDDEAIAVINVISFLLYPRLEYIRKEMTHNDPSLLDVLDLIETLHKVMEGKAIQKWNSDWWTRKDKHKIELFYY